MTKFAVACICVGDKYNINDVKKLEKMVFNNTSLDINFTAFCIGPVSILNFSFMLFIKALCLLLNFLFEESIK